MPEGEVAVLLMRGLFTHSCVLSCDDLLGLDHTLYLNFICYVDDARLLSEMLRHLRGGGRFLECHLLAVWLVCRQVEVMSVFL